MSRTQKTKPTIAVTAEEADMLHRLRHEASNRIGRHVSTAQVVRALVHWVAPLIARELDKKTDSRR